MNFTFNVVIELGPNALLLGEKLLATLADFTAKLDAIDTTVTAIKAEIADLKTQIAAGGLTAAEEATVLARLDTLESNLTAAE